ncbi:MAG: peptidoglycan DD-metalloendopeptidase family protein [Lachnospiraceae bacterium]|nr:peptidoglycan DD-metalloendopeptidase family protein [Lachnospiraceae bacterium]
MFSRFARITKYSHVCTMILVALVSFLIDFGSVGKVKETGSRVTVFVNGTAVGVIDDAAKVEELVIRARKRLAMESDGQTLINCDIRTNVKTDVFNRIDDDETVVNNIYRVFSENVFKTKEPVYEVKINEFTVNLRTANEVHQLLIRAKQQYDKEDDYTVDLVLDPTRELNVLTTAVNKSGETEDSGEELFPTAGVVKKVNAIFALALNQDVSQFHFGVTNLDFGENVEVVQAYADPEKISTLEEAIDLVTKEKEKSKIYEVVAGDSLSVIADKNNTTIDNLIALNPGVITSAKSLIRPGDEIKVNSPEPELSVMRTEEVYYEENYNKPIEYINNDEWFTNESVVRREPVEGFRKVVADVTYRNDNEESREIIYEDVVVDAVAKVVERGTKVPPTYLKPISGGRMSSGFGKRKAPKRGASTYHKGIDWATPVGTAVYASSGGTVVRAGWGSGYGNVVMIQHPDGKETRYGHLSKVLVKVGQQVGQGQKIALSGNTGVSTGPHIHFEILVGGVQVNPLKYLQ